MKQSRRDFLQKMMIAAAGSPFASLAQSKPKPRVRAKSIIQIWMWGGPSHLDTFDPKPEAGSDFCGPLKNPIETNVKGIRICEQFPNMAKQADKYTIIRSMTHGVFAHETASYLTQTGRPVSGKTVFPSIGSIVSMERGYDHGYKSSIPPYVVLTTPQGRFSKAGFLGQKYKPFITGGDPNIDPFLVDGFVVKGIDKYRQGSRREMLNELTKNQRRKNSVYEQINQSRNNAYRLLTGDDIKVFDITQENEKIREAYGRNWFGQSCLAARRLVERGVPYITINYPGWDTHKQHFNSLTRKHPDLDKGLAMLIKDLSDRGLLDQTIVWWGGEFGRTPRVQWDAPWNGGRSHWGRCFNSVVAGGGFKGGTVVGSSSKTGEEVAERPVYPQDLLGSFCELMGIDPDSPMKNNVDLKVPIMAPASKYGRLNEIMKI